MSRKNEFVTDLVTIYVTAPIFAIEDANAIDDTSDDLFSPENDEESTQTYEIPDDDYQFPSFQHLVFDSCQYIFKLSTILSVLLEENIQSFLFAMIQDRTTFPLQYSYLFFSLLSYNKLIYPKIATDLFGSKILFNNQIWNPKITIFQHTNDDVISFRYEILKFLFKENFSKFSSFLKDSICVLFIQSDHNFLFYAELLFILSKIYNPENSSNSFLSQLLEHEKQDISLFTIIGEHLKSDFSPNLKNIKIFTLKILKDAILQIKNIPYVPFGQDPPFHSSLLELIESNSEIEHSSMILQYSYNNLYSTDPNHVNFYTEPIIQKLQNLGKDFKQNEEKINLFLTIIYKSFHKIKGITFKQIIQSKFYINLVNLFFKDNIQISTFILLIRIFIICARIDRNNSIKIDYVKFTEKLKNFDINDEFYNLIIILITCRKGNVNYIGN